MANSEDTSQSEVGVLVLGSPESLRNPDLQFIHPNVRFSPPVYLASDFRPGAKRLFFEFLLNGKFLTVGERGCSQGHINIRTEILSSPQVWTLVLEDDVGLPLDWLRKVRDVLPGFPHAATPGVILLNTNPHFNLGTGLMELRLVPSGANAFLVHKAALDARTFTDLEYLERADWPTSFSGVQFWSLSNIAFEIPTDSKIGPRKRRRARFLVSTLLRALFSPLFSRILKIPVQAYLSWSVFGPLNRDVKLRLNIWKKLLPDS